MFIHSSFRSNKFFVIIKKNLINFLPLDVSTVLFKITLLLFTNFSFKSTPASKTNELPELNSGNVSLFNSNYTVSLPPATLKQSNMASGQTESSIFNKEGPSHHNKLPNNTQGVTQRVAMSAGF